MYIFNPEKENCKQTSNKNDLCNPHNSAVYVILSQAVRISGLLLYINVNMNAFACYCFFLRSFKILFIFT